MRIKNRESGNALIEFSLSIIAMTLLMIGTFQFGYAFYVYNQLQAAVRSGARFAASQDYQLNVNNQGNPSATCQQKMIDNVKNVVVYGTQSPPNNAVPIVRGLATSNVAVNYNEDDNSFPLRVDVWITNFSISSIGGSFSINGKPFAQMPYIGLFQPVSNC